MGSGRGIEALAVVLDSESEMRIFHPQPQADAFRLGVLGHVLQRFETAEVDAGLGLARLPRYVVDLEVDRYRDAADLGPKRNLEAVRRQEWRIDTSGEVAHGVERGVSVLLQLRDQAADLGFRRGRRPE